MLHKMNLHDSPFNFIKSGKKDIEMRLYDEKRKQIKIGDVIEFTNNTTNETIKVVVLKLHIFKTFADIYLNFAKTRLGYEENEKASFLDMEKYYSQEKIAEYGVVGIQILLLDKITPEILVDYGISSTCFDK